MAGFKKALGSKAVKAAAAKTTKLAAVKVTAIVVGTAVPATGIIGGTVYYKTEVMPEKEAEVAAEETVYAEAETEETASYADAMLAVSTGEATEADYITVADYYLDNGENLMARDTLEKCCKLYESEEAKEKLKYIVVDVSEEDSAIEHLAENLVENLEVTDDFPEVFHLLEDDLWVYSTPSETGTIRNYATQLSDGTLVFFSVEINTEGNVYSRTMYQQNGVLKQIEMEGQLAKYAEIALSNGESVFESNAYLTIVNGDESYCDGTCTAYSMDGSNGDLTIVNGTLSAGALTGQVEVKYHTGKTALDPYDMWNSVDKFKYTEHTGEITETASLNTLLSMNEEEISATVTKAEEETVAANTSGSGSTGKTTSKSTSSSTATTSNTTAVASTPAASTNTTSTTTSTPSTSTTSTYTADTSVSYSSDTSSSTSSSTSQDTSSSSSSSDSSSSGSSNSSTSSGDSGSSGSSSGDSGSSGSSSGASESGSGSSSGDSGSSGSSNESGSSGSSGDAGSSNSGDTDVGWTSDMW